MPHSILKAPVIPPRIFVAGIGTGVGKTFASAVLTAGLDADYWKPIQAGTEPQTDTQWVQQTLALDADRLHPEAYKLQHPLSPHAAAALAGITIDPEKIEPPISPNRLIVEGAGGVMVPLNNDTLYIDLMARWQMPVVLVVDLYLGCINHTLLTVEALKCREIPIMGLLFNENEQLSSRQFLIDNTKLLDLGMLPRLPEQQMNYTTLKSLYQQHINIIPERLVSNPNAE